MNTIQPFQVAISSDLVDDLKRRLSHTRWAEDFGNETWTYGVEAGWLRGMAAYWQDEYDWRRHEAAINRYPQFITVIDDVPIHFLHVRGKGPNPKPLILTHGWPWTFWDYRHVIEPLTDPASHGGRSDESFDLIIPSLPGFGFSSPLRQTGVNVTSVSGMWIELMNRLGYDRFALSGGDFGAAVSGQMGHLYPDRVTGVHLTTQFYPGINYARIGPDDYAEDEKWMLQRMQDIAHATVSHVMVHTSDPQTLAYAMMDSPVGTAAWIWERRRAWSDCDGDISRRFDRDTLCTLASIYWLGGTIGTSFRLYAESFRNGFIVPRTRETGLAIEVPTGFTVMPRELMLAPRSVVEANVNVAFWNVLPRGGHFGHAEEPALVVEDIRTFLSGLS